MKKPALMLALATLLLPTKLLAMDLNAGGTTLFRYQERSVQGFDKQQLAPVTQYLSADLEKLADGNLSFHLNGWGRADLADRSAPDDTVDGSLATGYLSYRFDKANAELKAGRFFVFEGGTVENIDGISARSDLLKYYEGLALSLYAGKPVKIDHVADNKGDFIAGGRLSYRVASIAEIGASILHETGATTASYDATTGAVTATKDYRQQVGVDIWLAPCRQAELSGRSLYDAAATEWAEHRYQLTLRPMERLSVTGDYKQVNFAGAFAAASNPSLFKPDAGDELTTFGALASYKFSDHLELDMDYRHYDRKRKGTSDRGGAEARFTMMDGQLRSGFGYHRLGAAQGINSYHEMRGYGLYDPGTYTLSLDAIADLYDDHVYLNTDKVAYEVIASAGYRLRPELMLSADLSAGSNPQYGDEVKGLVRLTFNYAMTTKGVGR